MIESGNGDHKVCAMPKIVLNFGTDKHLDLGHATQGSNADSAEVANKTSQLGTGAAGGEVHSTMIIKIAQAGLGDSKAPAGVDTHGGGVPAEEKKVDKDADVVMPDVVGSAHGSKGSTDIKVAPLDEGLPRRRRRRPHKDDEFEYDDYEESSRHGGARDSSDDGDNGSDGMVSDTDGRGEKSHRRGGGLKRPHSGDHKPSSSSHSSSSPSATATTSSSTASASASAENGSAPPTKTAKKPGNYERHHGPMIPHFAEGNKYPFMVNKWVNIRCFGSFDLVKDGSTEVPAEYGVDMVCKGLASTLWPIGFTSARLFHDYTGEGVMRIYLCTVRLNPNRPHGLIWRIQVASNDADFTEAEDTTTLMNIFKGKFSYIRPNPIITSWLSDAEHFFGMSYQDVSDVVHCLPHHNSLLKLLNPAAELPHLPAVPRVLPSTPYSEEPPQPKRRSRPQSKAKATPTPQASPSPSNGSRPPSSNTRRTEDHSASASSTSVKKEPHSSYSSRSLTWASQPIQPVPMSMIPTQSEPNSSTSPVFSESPSERQLNRLQDVLSRAEQIISYLSETNRQLHMVECIYSQNS